MLTREQLKALRAMPLRGANRVAEAMELAGVTQVELAAAIGLTQSYVSRICTGRYESLPLETSRKLADYFGCHIEDLFPARSAVSA